MLLYTQHAWAGRPFALGILASQKILEPALYRRTANAFPPAQATPVYPVPVRHKNAPPKRFRRPLARPYPRKTLPKAPAAILTSIFAGF